MKLYRTDGRMCFDKFASVERVCITGVDRTRLAVMALRNDPYEAVAALTGAVIADRIEVTNAISVPNLARSRSYFVTRASYLETAATVSAGTLIGLFHSHRKEPTPSREDEEAMERWPGLWLIGGPAGADFDLSAHLTARIGDAKCLSGLGRAAAVRRVPVVVTSAGEEQCSAD